ncbi:hypothetical protein FK220_002770 [Flavobacteriaceae bacterium TP-CH-4]|uniref:Uncharacterized protein n=1 Tax=Pelagihabitans pacificus TaxID=2696054 RepID=A0A967E5M5_9FLAO|nr:hypothetical protein [Pelagihabitans pacificus]NHF58249.1 hypothetical protein [Pelagihabitans pacificus]
MRKLFYVALFCGVGSFSFAQYSGQVMNYGSGAAGNINSAAVVDSYLGSISEREAKLKNRFGEMQGSPYVANTFLPTTVYYQDENNGQVFYRYNALNEEVEIKKTTSEDEPIRSLSRDKDVSIMVDGNKKMSFKTFITEKNKTMNGYLMSLLDGKTYDLYKRIHIKFTEGTPATNSFTKDVPARFTQFTEYYFQKEGVNRIDEIPLKNNKLLKMLDSDKKGRVKEYLKENNLNIKNEIDLIKTFQYLEQL